MTLYSYVIIDSTNLHEITGVIESPSVHEAIFSLQSKGYLVREIKIASADDIRLAKLKNFRRRISSNPDKRPKLKEVKPAKINYNFPWYLLFLCAVIALIIISLFLERF
jgi:hypothetical protein